MLANYEQAAEMERKYNELADRVRALQIAEETAKQHPTRDARIRAWKAKVDLYQMVRLRVGQIGLFTK